jgi:uncharacterized protein YdhG (YjbR/CyaY superfamily)
VSRDEDIHPVDAYLAAFEGEVRAALDQLRALLREAVPGAMETISYGIPTLDLDDKHVVHFASYARHVGLYPTPSGMKAFDAELRRYAHGKGSVRFPLGEPLPVDLIRRIAAFRVAEVAAASGGAAGGVKAGTPPRREVPQAQAPAARGERHARRRPRRNRGGGADGRLPIATPVPAERLPRLDRRREARGDAGAPAAADARRTGGGANLHGHAVEAGER